MTEITSQLSTALAARYRIGRRLGEGGMARVYLARAIGVHIETMDAFRPTEMHR
jgi:hypothetical protein